MKMKSLFILSTMMLVFSSCESNPFPENGQIVNGNEPVQRKVPPPYTIDVAATLKFKEGVNRAYPLKFYVPSGEAVYSFVGLPDGMQFDETDKKLSWEPGYEAANDVSDPLVKLRRIPVEIWLRSSEDENTAIKKDIIVEVLDTPRNFSAKSDSRSHKVEEGKTLNERVVIENEDFPTGPFKVRYENLPNSLLMTARENEISLSLTPGYFEVGVDDSCGFYSCEKKFDNGKIIITAPDGREFVLDHQITIEDTRLDPVFSTPDEINQGLDVNFIVSAYDGNAEVEPLIELINKPRDGEVEFQAVKSFKNSLKQTHMKFIWKNIPASRRGTTQEFSFRACNYNFRKVKRNCVTKDVNVKIKEQLYLSPVFNRENWQHGYIDYIGFNKSKEVRIDIEDGNDSNRELEAVEVYPLEMREYVSYSNGKIKIKDNMPGLKQFKLKAKSIYDIESSELFTYEVLPENWSRNLTVINSFRSNEIISNRNLFESVDSVNSDFQQIDRRLLSERETLIIGTDSLRSPEQINEVEKIATQIKNVIISTPLLQSLDGDLSKEINELGVVARGRFNSVTNGKLTDYYFFIGKDVDLDYPRRRVFLNGALTNESVDPMLLNKKINSECVEIFSIGDDATGLDHLVSVKCARKNGGYILINGFEFGDLKMHQDDADISAKWIKKLMENR